MDIGAEPLPALPDDRRLSLLLHTADTAPDEPERTRERIIVPLSADPDDRGFRPRGRESDEAVLHFVEGGIPKKSVRSAGAGNDCDEARVPEPLCDSLQGLRGGCLGEGSRLVGGS